MYWFHCKRKTTLFFFSFHYITVPQFPVCPNTTLFHLWKPYCKCMKTLNYSTDSTEMTRAQKWSGKQTQNMQSVQRFSHWSRKLLTTSGGDKKKILCSVCVWECLSVRVCVWMVCACVSVPVCEWPVCLSTSEHHTAVNLTLLQMMNACLLQITQCQEPAGHKCRIFHNNGVY